MHQSTDELSIASPAQAVFAVLLRFRWGVLFVAFGAILLAAWSLPQLQRDTSSDAFISQDAPALVYKNEVEDVFGLTEPLIIAIIDDDDRGIFRPETLALVEKLTRAVERIPQIDPDRVVSLATEKSITGSAEGISTTKFLEPEKTTLLGPGNSQEHADKVRASIKDFPLLQGSLVSKDGHATIIAAELLSEEFATEAYDAFTSLIDQTEHPESIELHVAGEGAISGYLSVYIDQDARRLNPLAAVVITIVLLITFMSVRAAILPNLIIVATVISSFGLMAAVGSKFYVITNGLVVNLIGIAVADSIHIVSEFYNRLRANPSANKKTLVANTMSVMWRPVTLTTVTTIAGFLALAGSSVMPPVSEFGLFGALGVFLAWVYSMTLLPAMLTIWPTKRLPAPFRATQQSTRFKRNLTENMLIAFGRNVLNAPKLVLVVSVLIACAAVLGASKVTVDESRIDNFKPTEPIFQADKAINATMDGAYNLDILVETDAPERLFEPGVLRRIERLQEFVETLPAVRGSTSIVDYVKQLHRVVNDGDAAYYTVPDNAALIAQLFFLYSASAEPTDFDEEVDFDFQRALIRARVNTDQYSNSALVVPQLEQWIEENFNYDGVKATVTGRVSVNYHWVNGIDRSNLMSVFASFVAVWIMAALVFRSWMLGTIAVIPVATAVLCVYGAMGFFNVPLGVGTSMFAAIAIGLSIDFSIHALDKLRDIAKYSGLEPDTLIQLYPSTGRALLFNFLAVAGGFGLLVSSDVPPLVKFGSLVALAVSVAFLASITVLPALVSVFKPAALFNGSIKESANANSH